MSLTKAQIRVKLNELQRKRVNYVNERSKYNISLSHANKLLSSLKKENDNLMSVENNLNKHFKVNGKSADNKEIDRIKKEVLNIKSKLEKNIIPSINNNIKSLTNQISNTDYNINYYNRLYREAQE